MSLCVCVILLLINGLKCTTYYVNPDNPNTNGLGRNWNNAFLSVDDAFAAVTKAVDVIWLIGDKTYYPSTTNRFNCFIAPKSIEIYGGFVGNETSINDRPSNKLLYPTIISGNINNINDNTDNCYHVLTYNQNLLLDRVTISDGYANYQNYNDSNYVLHKYGGALIRSNSLRTELQFYDVTFRDNTAINGGALWFGANAGTDVTIVIKNCIFENNRAINGNYEGGYGGAIYSYFLVNITIFDTEFISNYAQFRGGAIYQDYGSLLYCNGCTFNSNSVNGYGGAIFSEDRNSQTAGTFPVIISSYFINNNANIYGGSLCWFNGVKGSLINNIFTSNIAGISGGALSLFNSELTIDSGNTYNHASDDIYNEQTEQYTHIDNTLSFDITSELNDIYTIFNTNYDEINLVSFSSSNPLCYVDIDNTNPIKNGLSWHNAYNDLQQCLDSLSISGGEIWVKYGIYKPTSIPEWKTRSGKTQIIHRSFSMYNNTRMYGGFIGTETNRNQRNFNTNPTYLSCNIFDGFVYCNQILQAADNCIIDGFIFIEAGYSNTGNNRRRLLANSVSVEEVLSSTAGNSGSGIFSNSTNIVVVNSIFYKLFSSGKGAGLYCIGLEGDQTTIKSPKLINVKFLGNRAVARGGAISADAQCNFECKYCTFDSNSCNNKGGAIYLDFDCNPIFYNVVFKNNYALESGGCIAADGKSTTSFVEGAEFRNNWAKWEGGCLYSGSGSGYSMDAGYILLSAISTFTNNYLIHNTIGQNDIYVWPYSQVISSILTSSPTTNTLSPTTMTPTSPTLSPTTDKNTPNILIVLIDDIEFTTDWSHSAPKGVNLNTKTITYLDISTPHINALLNDNTIIFPRAYAAAPKCAPSRFTLLTGRQPSRSVWGRIRTLQSSSGDQGTNVTVQISKLYGDDEIFNIPYMLKNNPNVNNRWYTAMIGKWHLLTSNDNDHEYGCVALATTQNATLYNLCKNIVLHQQSFDVVDSYYDANIESNRYFNHNPEWKVHTAQKAMDHAINVEKKPFFIYFATTLAHTPKAYNALSNYTIRDTPKGILTGTDRPINTGMKTRNEIWTDTLSYGYRNQGKNNKIAATIWIDETIGALVTYLKDNNVYNNTMIVIVNDHGMGAKGVLYEQGVRILQFIRYPPLYNNPSNPGPYILPEDFIVSNTDLAASIFDIVDIELDNSYYVSDGKSWVNDVKNEINQQGSIGTPNCCEYRYIDIFNSHAIVSKQWKYIYRATLEIEQIANVEQFYPNIYDEQQLYNLELDPSEQHNQFNNSTLSDIVQMFQIKMRTYIQDVACPLQSGCKIPDIIPTTNPSEYPTYNPSNIPTFVPTSQTINPSKPPSKSPTNNPSVTPSITPSVSPFKSTFSPSKQPTQLPSITPTQSPSYNPTNNPTTLNPTNNPSTTPTLQPTFKSPTNTPTKSPTIQPSLSPTFPPSYNPSSIPSTNPSYNPTGTPSNYPSKTPSNTPILAPTYNPTLQPSNNPSIPPTKNPTTSPNNDPTVSPTEYPSVSPSTPTNIPSNTPITNHPTYAPSTISPSAFPTYTPSDYPSKTPSYTPILAPTYTPTVQPSNNPSIPPTKIPTASPNNDPTISPTQYPSISPTSSTITPSNSPSKHPSVSPSASTNIPSNTSFTHHPTYAPSTVSPSTFPTLIPSKDPTTQPSINPIINLSTAPSATTHLPATFPTSLLPTLLTTVNPTFQPSHHPTYTPTTSPTSIINNPTNKPTIQPSILPSFIPSILPSTTPTKTIVLPSTLYPTIALSTKIKTNSPSIMTTNWDRNTNSINTGNEKDMNNYHHVDENIEIFVVIFGVAVFILIIVCCCVKHKIQKNNATMKSKETKAANNNLIFNQSINMTHIARQSPSISPMPIDTMHGHKTLQTEGMMLHYNNDSVDLDVETMAKALQPLKIVNEQYVE